MFIWNCYHRRCFVTLNPFLFPLITSPFLPLGFLSGWPAGEWRGNSTGKYSKNSRHTRGNDGHKEFCSEETRRSRHSDLSSMNSDQDSLVLWPRGNAGSSESYDWWTMGRIGNREEPGFGKFFLGHLGFPTRRIMANKTMRFLDEFVWCDISLSQGLPHYSPECFDYILTDRVFEIARFDIYIPIRLRH